MSTSRRLTLYANSFRNTVGRSLGATWAYTSTQVVTARAMWLVFHAHGYDDDTCAALLGCVDGECSFILTARGDHDQAGGACQWHYGRRNIIAHYTLIDVWDAPADKQAQAIIGELSDPWSAYRHVEAALKVASGIDAKMSVLLKQFEQSASQARDLARRVPMAQYWHDRAATEGWSATA